MNKSSIQIFAYAIFKNTAQHYLRNGRLFRRLLAQLESNATLNYDQLLAYQEEHLRLAVGHAYAHVPFYRKQFDAVGLLPGDIRTVEDLNNLPIIGKEDVRGHESEFQADNVRVKFKNYTSGTTGSPITLQRDLYSINFEHACRWRQWQWYGFSYGERMGYLRGMVITQVEREKPPFWLLIPPGQLLLLSSYHLSDEFIPYYLEKLRNSPITALKGIPSTLYRIALYMHLHQEEPIPMTAVFTTSEQLISYEREIIERYFGPVYDFYGNAERVAFMAMCEFGQYHYMMDHSVIEFLPREDGLYEVVGTSLHNKAMPFIRYATGDIVSMGPGECECGRAFPVIKSIQGRQEGMVVTPSGRWLSSHLAMTFYGANDLVKTQIVQDEANSIRVRMVVGAGFSAEDEQLISRNLRSLIGDEMSIIIEKVPEIPPTEQGKHQFIISKIPIPN